MSDRSRNAGHRVTEQQLQYAAAALAFAVAVVHLFHPQFGFGRFVVLLSVDPALLLTHPRPLAFVLSGFAIIVGINAVALGVPKRPIYALGIALMVTYVVGYFAWHFTGHGGFLPGREPHYHGLSPLETVLSHLRHDLWAATAVVLEIVLAGLLAVLYARAS